MSQPKTNPIIPWRMPALLLLSMAVSPLSCVEDQSMLDGARDGSCGDWAPNRCGRPDGCFAEPGTCEDIFGGPRQCAAGNWTPVGSCSGGDGGGDDGGGECLSWSAGRCGRPDGCFAESGACEEIFGGPRECSGGSWTQVAACGGDDGGDDGGGDCQPWANGRCGLPDGCFADPGTCAEIFGGPRVCEAGSWNAVPSCGDGDGGDDGGGGEVPPLPAYGVGLDPGSMVNGANGHVWFHDPAIFDLPANEWRDNLDLMELSGTQYVRVNFIRPAGWTEQAWLDLYDPLVDELIAADLVPYALVSAEAVAQPFPAPWLEVQGGEHVAIYDANAQATWIQDHYAPAFRAVVDRFDGRIQVYESFNEPDNWFLHSPTGLVESPRLRAHTFAEMLDTVYDEVKDDGIHDDVLLVSGPLVGHDHGGFAAASNYLRNSILHGEQFLGWGGNSYPFDGVGYHIYVAQGTANGFGVQGSVAGSLDAMHSMLVQEIGASATDTRGELWISELGWATPGVTEQTQRDALEATLNYLRGQSWRVRMSMWYQVGDTPSEGGFGLIRPHFMHSDDDPTRFKLGWDEFISQAALAAP